MTAKLVLVLVCTVTLVPRPYYKLTLLTVSYFPCKFRKPDRRENTACNSSSVVSLLSYVFTYISLVVAGQRLGKHVPASTNTRNNRRIA
jgi:hypothetical protein